MTGFAFAASASIRAASSVAIWVSSLVANLMSISGVMSGSEKPGVFRVSRRGAWRMEPEMESLVIFPPGIMNPAPS